MKIVIVKSSAAITWQSCISILDNLEQAYSQLNAETLTIELPEKASLSSHKKIMRVVAKFCPEKIVFLDYRAKTYQIFMEKLATHYTNKKEKPSLYFHIYGNFTLEPNAWSVIDRSLREFSAYLLCASKKQARLVGSFLLEGQKNILVCPFPVNTKKFFFDAKKRTSTRKKMGWEKEFVFLYAGRISPQKNVIPMLESLLKQKYPCRIVLAGSFDKMHSPMFQKKAKKSDAYQKKYFKFIRALPLAAQEKVQYLGPLPQKKLSDIYSASDCLICLSTYHDEDFGMAPAEALSTGLPSILSDWGGFSDFPIHTNHCRVAPVQIKTRGIEIDFAAFQKNAQWAIRSQKKMHQSRRTFVKKTRATYSIAAVSRQLKSLLKKPEQKFSGFNKKLKIHRYLLGRDFGQEIYLEASQKDEYYFSNYSHYTGQNLVSSGKRQ